MRKEEKPTQALASQFSSCQSQRIGISFFLGRRSTRISVPFKTSLTNDELERRCVCSCMCVCVFTCTSYRVRAFWPTLGYRLRSGER